MKRRMHHWSRIVLATVAVLATPSAVAVSRADTIVYSFGGNGNGRTGLGFADSDSSTIVPTPINPTNLFGKTITQISAAAVGTLATGSHSLLLADDGTVFPFGNNSNGRTGLFDPLPSPAGNTVVATPIDTTNLSGNSIVGIAAGGANHSLLVGGNGTVYSFGSNASGRTGQNTTSGNTLLATPIAPTVNLAGKTITQASGGTSHSLILDSNGAVYSFGNNGSGQLGRNTSVSGSNLVAAAIDVSALPPIAFTQVAAGNNFSLLLADDGTVYSFGTNANGVTGLGTDGSNTQFATPIVQTNLAGKTIVQVSAGGIHGLLLADDGTVFAFGNNANGRNGLGLTGTTTIATQIGTSVAPGFVVTQVSAGSNYSLLLAAEPIPEQDVPESSSLVLLLFGSVGIAAVVWRQRRMASKVALYVRIGL